MSVDGKSTQGLSSSEVADMLKGPKGTIVHIFHEACGLRSAARFHRYAGYEIPKHSVDIAFRFKTGIGYIKLSGFNETTEPELAAALKQVDSSTLDGLVLDLRGNPGGLLMKRSPFPICFGQNQLIVSHHGRSSQERRYYAVRGKSRRPPCRWL